MCSAELSMNKFYNLGPGPDTLENHKATKPLGYHRPASETPFKWCFSGGPMMTRFYLYT